MIDRVASLFGIVALLLPIEAQAQDASAVKTAARSAASELKNAGEPKDRCSIGAFLADGPIVLRTYAATPLRPGDKIVVLGNRDTKGMTADSAIDVLRGTAPSAVLPVVVERDGKHADLQIACANSRPTMAALVDALDKAATGKFDDCVSSLASRPDFGTYGALLRAQCAAASKRSKELGAGELTFEAMKMVIQDANWSPPSRARVAEQLRAMEGPLSMEVGQSRFDELVTLTRGWQGGETTYASSAPDWSAFRRTSEQALVSRLIDPDSARIEWPHGFTYGTWKPLLAKRIEGYWTCGLINARNRMGGYTGATSFVVVLSRSGSVLYSEVGSGRDYDLLSSQCAKSLQYLPAPPAELSASSVSLSSSSPSSLADDLKKLVELRASGGLTEAEFQAAKAKLLGGK